MLLRGLSNYLRKYEAGIPETPPQRICLLPWFSLYIAVNGDVRPCCSFAEGNVCNLGNLFEQSFAEIWNSEKYQALRQQALDLDLDPTTVLVGANDTGKSAILDDGGHR